MTPTYYGKYRGTIANNVDPLERGRVQVSVPAVLGDGSLSWAEACTPYAGNGVGIFAVPPIGANVWVEFEAGDPDRPILAGCFWAAGEVPASPALPQVFVWKTESISMTMSDLSGAGGFSLEVGPPGAAVPMTLACTSDGIELSIGAAKVLLTAASVSINDGALEVI